MGFSPPVERALERQAHVADRLRALPWTVAGVFGVVMIAGLVLWAPWRSAPVP